jgi:uncharacterized protein YgbK (DUF1537 family)
MTLVLADDLTGLTELAGLATNAGMRGWLYPALDAWRQEPVPGPAPRFVNLACRTFSPAEASAAVEEALAIAPSKTDHIYLKVDSVARGPVLAMVRPLLGRNGARRLPMMLTNPATSRAVHEGQILVEGTPLDRTAFRHDPMHPARSSSLRKVLETGMPGATGPELESLLSGLTLLNGETVAEVEGAAEQWAQASTAAGAAPFGVSLLKRWCPPAITTDEMPALPFKHTLAVCGTAHESGIELAEHFEDLGGTVVRADEPARRVRLPLIILPTTERGDARVVLENLIDRAVDLFQQLDPGQVLLTGGETAQAFLDRLDWPELVAVSYRHPIALLSARLGADRKPILMKPGSYLTPGLLTSLFTV